MRFLDRLDLLVSECFLTKMYKPALLALPLLQIFLGDEAVPLSSGGVLN